MVLSLPFSSYIKWKLYFMSHAASFDLFKKRQNTSTQRSVFLKTHDFLGLFPLRWARLPMQNIQTLVLGYPPHFYEILTTTKECHMLWIQKDEKPAEYMNRTKGRIKYNTRAGSRIPVYGLTLGSYVKRNTAQKLSLGIFLNRLSLYNARAGALYILTWRKQTWTNIFNANV